jgi:mannosyltransferase OCH1-like enzyme
MIPSTIYRIWLNDHLDPPAFEKVEGYGNHLVKLKNIYSFVNQTDYLKESIKQKKWVHAADYLRLLILYKYGGIYLDTDIKVLNKFDDLEHFNLFAGFEDANSINTAVIGCSKQNPVIGEMLIKMDELFKKEGLYCSPNQRGPVLFTEVIKNACHIHLDNRTQIDTINNAIILKSKVFYPYHYTEQYTDDCISEETRTIHYWNHSWK